MQTLILGLGNLLLADEGIGVHVARALAAKDLPPGVSVVEAGTAFLDVLPEIEEAERILLVDAMEAGGTPGSVYRVPFDQCRHPAMLASLHGFDMSRVLFMAQNYRAPSVTVIGVEPARIEWGTALSPALQKMMPALIDIVLKEVM